MSHTTYADYSVIIHNHVHTSKTKDFQIHKSWQDEKKIKQCGALKCEPLNNMYSTQKISKIYI